MTSPVPKFTVAPALPNDYPRFAAIMTSANITADAVYHIIWGKTAPQAHTKAAATIIATPGSVLFKAIDNSTGEIAGFASFMPQKGEGSATEDSSEKKQESDHKWLEGLNVDLFRWKVGGPLKETRKKLFDVEKDSGIFFEVSRDYI